MRGWDRGAPRVHKEARLYWGQVYSFSICSVREIAVKVNLLSLCSKHSLGKRGQGRKTHHCRGTDVYRGAGTQEVRYPGDTNRYCLWRPQ